MFNQVVLVGRVSVTLQEGSLNRSWIVVDIKRSTKGVFAEDYPVDSIRVYLREGLLKNASQYATLGKMVALRASIEVEHNENLIIADRFSWLREEGKEE